MDSMPQSPTQLPAVTGSTAPVKPAAVSTPIQSQVSNITATAHDVLQNLGTHFNERLKSVDRQIRALNSENETLDGKMRELALLYVIASKNISSKDAKPQKTIDAMKELDKNGKAEILKRYNQELQVSGSKENLQAALKQQMKEGGRILQNNKEKIANLQEETSRITQSQEQMKELKSKVNPSPDRVSTMQSREKAIEVAEKIVQITQDIPIQVIRHGKKRPEVAQVTLRDLKEGEMVKLSRKKFHPLGLDRSVAVIKKGDQLVFIPHEHSNTLAKAVGRINDPSTRIASKKLAQGGENVVVNMSGQFVQRKQLGRKEVGKKEEKLDGMIKQKKTEDAFSGHPLFATRIGTEVEVDERSPFSSEKGAIYPKAKNNALSNWRDESTPLGKDSVVNLGKPVPFNEAMIFLWSNSVGRNLMEKKHVYHDDNNLKNILVDKKGLALQTDFDGCRHMDNPTPDGGNTAIDETNTFTSAGTLAYNSPEFNNAMFSAFKGKSGLYARAARDAMNAKGPEGKVEAEKMYRRNTNFVDMVNCYNIMTGRVPKFVRDNADPTIMTPFKMAKGQAKTIDDTYEVTLPNGEKVTKSYRDDVMEGLNEAVQRYNETKDSGKPEGCPPEIRDLILRTFSSDQRDWPATGEYEKAFAAYAQRINPELFAEISKSK